MRIHKTLAALALATGTLALAACGSGGADDTAQTGLAVQNPHIGDTPVIGRHSRRHTGRAAANDNNIMIYHIIHRSFLLPYKSCRRTW